MPKTSALSNPAADEPREGPERFVRHGEADVEGDEKRLAAVLLENLLWVQGDQSVRQERPQETGPWRRTAVR